MRISSLVAALFLTVPVVLVPTVQAEDFPPAAESPDLKPKLDAVRTLARAGKHTEALAGIDAVLVDHPRSVEAWELKGDIAMADGNQTLARTAYREATRLDPSNDAEGKLAAIEPLLISTWTVRAGGTRDEFSAIRDKEYSLFGEVGYDHRSWRPEALDWDVHLGTAYEDRFDEDEWTMGGEAAFRPSRRVNLLAGGSWTPDNAWHSRYEVGGGLELALIDATVVGQPLRIEALGGIRHQDFDSGRILRIPVGGRLDLPGAFALTARWLPVADDRDGVTDGTEKTSAVEGVFSTRFRSWGMAQSSIGVRQGDDVEPPMATAKATTVIATIAVPFDRQFTLELNGSYQDREDAYTRWTVGGALAFRF